jgi:hypothetical protein
MIASSSCVASIYRAGIVVVAGYGGKNTTYIWLTGVISTSIIIVTDN